ncbi:hypothetical protein F3Y22_tig00111201pilonHSYRG00099 [Hibiscus syriacus]|uniref:Uncharacterized protein n=1 Tax=Hibiscus syriacus TaxID=106335 RepID=A0A6A2YWY0_HIBSY|nr:hypothetical protein F3Y22_tig00111201pilonHSYRG00099 [Hibiscus syriacus]
MEFSKNGDLSSITRTSRKLKVNGYNLSNEKRGEVDLEDYRHRIDPAPSSKASINKHGPIEHGTPLMPCIPKPPPPSNSKVGGSTSHHLRVIFI